MAATAVLVTDLAPCLGLWEHEMRMNPAIELGRGARSLRAQRFELSVADMQSTALAATRGLLPSYTKDHGLQFVGSGAQIERSCEGHGTQEILSLSDDLLLTRSDFHSLPAYSSSERWEFDYRGWLCMHFRADGLSEEETPDGRRWTLGADTFLLSTSTRRQSLSRELLGDTWRTVAIACRPAFVMQHLEVPGNDLPAELRCFRSGDANVDFWFAGKLSEDMKAAIAALLRPPVRSGVRPVYLRAKVVELACLALDRLREPAPARSTLELTSRDVASLYAARRILDESAVAPSLEELGRRVGLNRTKLAAGFKHVFGSTAGVYHRDRRLALARDLLAKPGTRVGCVAAAAGYADLGSFTKAFKSRYGSLPSLLRRGTGGIKT